MMWYIAESFPKDGNGDWHTLATTTDREKAIDAVIDNFEHSTKRGRKREDYLVRGYECDSETANDFEDWLAEQFMQPDSDEEICFEVSGDLEKIKIAD